MPVIVPGQWGMEAPSAADESESVRCAFPLAPGCDELIDDNTSIRMLKYRLRAHGLIDTADRVRVRLSLGDADTQLTIVLPVLVNAWDHTSTACHVQDSYPSNGTDFSVDWDSEVALPFSEGTVRIYVSETTITDRTINGVEVLVAWDEATCPSESVPVWNWSSPAICDAQQPAASVVVMKALCETYNRLIYGSVWGIAAAFPSDNKAA